MPDIDQINLDLDSQEREQVRGVPKKKTPWVVKMDGRAVPFKDPLDIDATVLMTMEDSPGRFFTSAIEKDDDVEYVLNLLGTPGKITGLKLRAIMQGYRTYYGIDEAGNVVASRR